MQRLRWWLPGMTGLALVVGAAAAHAQDAVRVRGTIDH
jgi:hypothetical protein